MKKNYFIGLIIIAILILIFLPSKHVKKSSQVSVSKNDKIVKIQMTPSVKIKPLQEVTVPKAIPAPIKEKLDLTTTPANSAAPLIEKDASERILTGILWDKSAPEAIINHTVVKIGDTVDGKKVVDIQEDKVILNDGSKDLEVKL